MAALRTEAYYLQFTCHNYYFENQSNLSLTLSGPN